MLNMYHARNPQQREPYLGTSKISECGSMKERAAPQTATGGVGESTVEGPPNDSLSEQYSLAKILGIWATAALPMAALAWVVAPLVADRLEGPVALPRALRGSLSWSVLKDALWLHSPRSPTTGRVGGRLWLVIIPAALLLGAEGFIPTLPPVAGHDFSVFLESEAGREFFSGNWVFYTVEVVLVLFNTVLGEELLFRGLLLPRMQGAFGRFDWVANGVLFALYHLHMPWVIPETLLIDTFAMAYPSRRYRSALIGIIVHSTPSVVVLVLLLYLVLQ